MKYYKGLLLSIILIFLLSALFFYSGEYMHGERVLDYASGDINGDGSEELVILTRRALSKYGDQVIVYSSEEEIYRRDFSELKPWKLEIGDIDGDGLAEVSIGVYKETIFHPVMAKRPFIYSFEQDQLFPKWRGSRLARPFTDYVFFDIDGDGIDEIISIEMLESGEKLINTYKWKGFGFEGYKESRAFKDIDNLRLEDDNLYIDTEDKGEDYTSRIVLGNEAIIIEKQIIK